MQIGTLAKATGTCRDALRLYEKRGLIRADQRTNGYRDDPEVSVAVVGIIRQAQSLGFTLAEISDIISSLNEDRLGEDQVAELLREKIAMIDTRMRDLGVLREMLQDRLSTACPLQLGSSAALFGLAGNKAVMPGSR